MKLGKEDKGKPCLEKPSPDTNWFIWDGIRGTRANQDYQRELEDTSLLDIENHLAGRRQGKLVKVTSNDASSYNSGGSFLKLEQVGKGSSSGEYSPLVSGFFLSQDWRDSHLAYLQHKTALNRPCRPSSAGKIRTYNVSPSPSSLKYLLFNPGLALREEIRWHEYGLPGPPEFRQSSKTSLRAFTL